MISAKAKLVLSYGPPRSGTTPLAAMFDRCHEFTHVAIPQSSPFHPAVSPESLAELVRLLFGERLGEEQCPCVIVRIVRNPLAIAESLWYAERADWPQNTGRKTLSDEALVETIIEAVTKESDGSQAFLSKFSAEATDKRRIRDYLVTIKYEHLDICERRTPFLNKLRRLVAGGTRSATACELFLLEHWNAIPFGDGRLKDGIVMPVVPEKWRGRLRDELLPVMQVEGYA